MCMHYITFVNTPYLDTRNAMIVVDTMASMQFIL